MMKVDFVSLSYTIVILVIAGFVVMQSEEILSIAAIIAPIVKTTIYCMLIILNVEGMMSKIGLVSMDSTLDIDTETINK